MFDKLWDIGVVATTNPGGTGSTRILGGHAFQGATARPRRHHSAGQRRSREEARGPCRASAARLRALGEGDRLAGPAPQRRRQRLDPGRRNAAGTYADCDRSQREARTGRPAWARRARTASCGRGTRRLRPPELLVLQDARRRGIRHHPAGRLAANVASSLPLVPASSYTRILQEPGEVPVGDRIHRGAEHHRGHCLDGGARGPGRPARQCRRRSRLHRPRGRLVESRRDRSRRLPPRGWRWWRRPVPPLADDEGPPGAGRRGINRHAARVRERGSEENFRLLVAGFCTRSSPVARFPCWCCRGSREAPSPRPRVCCVRSLIRPRRR